MIKQNQYYLLRNLKYKHKQVKLKELCLLLKVELMMN